MKTATAVNILSSARAAAIEVRAGISEAPLDRARFCLNLLEPGNPDGKLKQFLAEIEPLAVDDKHYWVGTFYTLLLTLDQRRAQAAYFTPPYLAEAVIDLALDAGFNLAKDDVLDPAAGGAAFLSTIAARMQGVGLEADDIVYRLNGIEIDSGLAEISEALIRRRISSSLYGNVSSGCSRRMIATGDALQTNPLAAYNLVIANPPYGRVTEADLPDDTWRAIARRGHVNKYALFAEFCLRMTKPGGITTLVIPSSFRAGPLYDRMRSFLRTQGQILVLGHVRGRGDVFVDVQQDISVLVIRKGAKHKTKVPVAFPDIEPQTNRTAAIRRTLPADPLRPWPTPELGDGVNTPNRYSEFAGFADTRERLDVLALDKSGSLVIIENKLDDSGRDVVWQALKYASYCSTLTQDGVIAIYQEYLGVEGDAVAKLAAFFEVDDLSEVEINKSFRQRILLVAANFRKEVTSTVLWLANYGIQVQCFLALLHESAGEQFLSLRQIIPTPTAEDYMISLAQKAREETSAEGENTHRYVVRREFWARLLARMNQHTTLFQGLSPTKDNWLQTGSGTGGISYRFLVTRAFARTELYLYRPGGDEELRTAFHTLQSMRSEIQEALGLPILWDEVEGRNSYKLIIESAGNIYDRDRWEPMIDHLTQSMVALERVMPPFLDRLGLHRRPSSTR